MSHGSALDKSTPGTPKGIFQRHQLLYFVDEGRPHGRAQKSNQSDSLVSAFLCHLLFLNKSTTSAHFKADFALGVELKRCVLTWVLLGCVVFMVQLLLSCFINLKKQPLEHQVFCGPTDRKRGFWWGDPISPHTPACLFVQRVSPFYAEKLSHLFFPYYGVLPDFLVFLCRCIPGGRIPTTFPGGEAVLG